MPGPFDVCVLGSANLDVVVQTGRIPQPGETVLGSSIAEHAGGKGLNQAVSAARSGAVTCFIGAVGDDEAGRRLRSVLSHDAIDDALVATVSAATGRAIITVDDDGENTIVVIPGANHERSPITELPMATVLLSQLEIPIEVVLAAFLDARRAGMVTILNPAPAADLPIELLAATDFIIPNEHEVERVGGAASLLAAGCTAVIVTRGGAGVDIITNDGTTHVDPFQVTPVDTTGAGDAFCGAFAAQLARGVALLSAVRWAAAAGALATTVAGAVPAQPTAAAVSRLLTAR